MKNVDLDEPITFLHHVFFLGCTQREGNSNESIVEEYKRCSKHETLLERNSKVNFLGHLFREKQSFGLVVWRVMRRNVWQDIASWKIKKADQMYKVSIPCLGDHQFKKEELEIVWEFSKVCSQIVLTCLCVAGMVGFDIFCSVNTFAQVVTQWTRAFDQRLACLISYIHRTSDNRHCCHVGNTAQGCRLGLFQYWDFDGDFEDCKYISDWILCIFGNRAFVLMGWKQISVSHSSSESEVISLNAGPRTDGLFLVDLWDLVLEVLHSSKNLPVRWDQTREDTNGNTNTKTKKHVIRDVVELFIFTSSQKQNFFIVLNV